MGVCTPLKIAIISDIHSNLDAFERVLADMNNYGFDECICLGDIVGYGPDPGQCIELIRKNEIKCLLGNHDAAVCGLLKTDYFNMYATRAIKWTIENTSDEEKEYLAKLPSIYKKEKIVFVHGALTKPFDYILDKNTLRTNADVLRNEHKDCNICFFGHSHVRLLSINESFEIPETGRYVIENFENDIVFINPGSVGQPRGGFSNNASYCIYNTLTGEIFYRSVQYNIESTYRKIVERGLPEYLGARLYKGQ